MNQGRPNGKDAENHAAAWLAERNIIICHRNYHCRYGEIDVIGLDADTLVFFEVRYRSNQRYGGAAASVNYAKQAKLIKAASLYLAASPQYANHVCRFDVIAYETPELSQPLWYKDAFRI